MKDTLLDSSQGLSISVSIEREASSQHHIKHHSSTPDVDRTSSVVFFLYDLRRHVLEGATEQLKSLGAIHSKPEVNDLHCQRLWIDDDVLKLDVSVTDIPLV